jgi:hypothetical protein
VPTIAAAQPRSHRVEFNNPVVKGR